MKNLIILLFTILLTKVNGQEEKFIRMSDSEEVIEKLDTYAKSLKSIKSDFTQVKHIFVLEEDIVSKGNFVFLKPSNVKWTYKDPIVYQISIVDGEFTINNEGKISEFDLNTNKIFGEINNMLISMVNGTILTNDMFEVVLYESDNFYRAELKPQNKEFKRFVLEIHITLEKEDMMVSKIKMIEASDDFTVIKFNNKEINSGLELFDVTIKK